MTTKSKSVTTQIKVELHVPNGDWLRDEEIIMTSGKEINVFTARNISRALWPNHDLVNCEVKKVE